ncbi:MAG: hypothetical protein HYS13_04295 [Planctomycetia bacterium]|nr:hypothetical protein [Planctomycetia bacterium]
MTASSASPRRTLLFAAIMLLAMGLFFAIVWQLVGERVQTADDYVLVPKNVDLTPPPPWIHSDVRDEALKSAGLDRGASLLDDGLAKRAYDAFRLHPWVEKVERVEKQYPARLRVDLVYRRPACIVESAGRLCAVDAAGVVLPSGDFTPNELCAYPRLAGVKSSPQAEAGTAWGDPVVSAGARLAAFLGGAWGEWECQRILPLPGQPSPARNEEPSETSVELEIVTFGGSRIVWGPAPRGPDDAAARSKVEQLRAYVAEHGELNSPPPRVIDLRATPLRATAIDGPQVR